MLLLCVFSSCILTEITCSESAVRSDIAGNGMIVYSSGGTTPPFDYGTTATYQCNDGYSLASGDSVRTCSTGDGMSSVGQWSGTAPVCSGIVFIANAAEFFCPDLDPILYIMHTHV